VREIVGGPTHGVPDTAVVILAEMLSAPKLEIGS
jgi:hypothetical protein